MIFSPRVSEPGGRGTPIYGLYRYVPQNRVPKCDVIENEVCEIMGFVKVF